MMLRFLRALVPLLPMVFVSPAVAGVMGAGNQVSSVITDISGQAISPATVTISLNGAGFAGQYPYAPLQIFGNGNTSMQAVMQNLSNGTAATSDLIFTTDLGSNSSYYFDIGVNSSKYSQSGFSAESSSDAFIESSDSNLILWAGINGGANNTQANEHVVIGSSLANSGNIAADISSNVFTIKSASFQVTSAGSSFFSGGGIIVASSATFQNGAFSVGGSTLVVAGGYATLLGTVTIGVNGSSTTIGLLGVTTGYLSGNGNPVVFTGVATFETVISSMNQIILGGQQPADNTCTTGALAIRAGSNGTTGIGFGSGQQNLYMCRGGSVVASANSGTYLFMGGASGTAGIATAGGVAYSTISVNYAFGNDSRTGMFEWGGVNGQLAFASSGTVTDIWQTSGSTSPATISHTHVSNQYPFGNNFVRTISSDTFQGPVLLSSAVTFGAGAEITISSGFYDNSASVPIGISSVNITVINDSTTSATFVNGCYLNGGSVTGSSVTVTLQGTQKVRVAYQGKLTNTTASALNKLNILQNGAFPSPFTSAIDFVDDEVTLTGASDPQTLNMSWVFNPGIGTWTYCLMGATSAGTMTQPNGIGQFSAEIVQ